MVPEVSMFMPSYQQQQGNNEVKVNNWNWQRQRHISLPQISLAANNGPPLFLSLLL